MNPSTFMSILNLNMEQSILSWFCLQGHWCSLQELKGKCLSLLLLKVWFLCFQWHFHVLILLSQLRRVFQSWFLVLSLLFKTECWWRVEELHVINLTFDLHLLPQLFNVCFQPWGVSSPVLYHQLNTPSLQQVRILWLDLLKDQWLCLLSWQPKGLRWLHCRSQRMKLWIHTCCPGLHGLFRKVHWLSRLKFQDSHHNRSLCRSYLSLLFHKQIHMRCILKWLMEWVISKYFHKLLLK